MFQESLNYHDQKKLFLSYGMIPSVLFGHNELSNNLKKIPAILTVFTSMFMHGGWMHLIGNIGYLYIFGDNIEDCMGRLKFIIFYLTCGSVAALSQCFVDINSSTPMIGASGAISGILGGYLLLYPKANIKVFVWFIIFIKTFNIPALYVLGAWILIQFFSFDSGASDGVAYAAHIGGFVAGILLIKFLKKIIIQIQKNLNQGHCHQANKVCHQVTDPTPPFFSIDFKTSFDADFNISLLIDLKTIEVPNPLGLKYG